MSQAVSAQQVIEVLTSRAVSFLENDLGITAESKHIYLKDVPLISLGHITTLVSMEGHISALFVFSYDQALINDIYKKYTQGMAIDESERDIYMEECAGEITNTVIGNATKDFERQNSLLTFTPPVVLKEAQNLIKKKNTRFYNAEIHTESGILNIFYIVPKETEGA